MKLGGKIGRNEFVVCSWWFVVNFNSIQLLFMPTIQKFEDLEVWQLARELSQRVYPLTFLEPISKDFRFKDQIRGTCGSIMDNIAEGFERGSKLEFINSLTIAKGEAGELKSQLYRGLDNHYFTPELFEELYNLTNCITKMLTSFINYLNKTNIKGQKFKERH
jgi:four helix bundle protein